VELSPGKGREGMEREGMREGREGREGRKGRDDRYRKRGRDTPFLQTHRCLCY